jgi:3-methylcrotonyl-CoA carboxylase alpha subunit
MAMIKSLLIANRGEIACRVIRTARKLGIRTVAVYSDADARALHVRQADEAVHIGSSPARESYLRGDKILEAARQSGAEAIHPGYGFLSENADFAQAVIDAGLIWVGPKPDSIRAMGLKDAAKKLMADAGVPVTPGYLGDDQSPERLKREADAIGYPVLIKAVAGGGGKGMRKVASAADFQAALESCKREATSSFGNDVVLLEKWIESPRHIEVQVFGDSHGNVVHLFERDCSLQRRHQKVIEEAPAPGMDEATREAVCSAAVRAAKAVNYENAGTIEFIADASEGLRADRIWFMEMNTRLQVEHPVTEEITGQDLVKWQLLVASGEELPKRQDELSINGHAIEARVYAEDPANGFLPSVGKLKHFAAGRVGRVETGVGEGDTVSPFYDPMIAKLVASGPTRVSAISQLATMLEQFTCWPVRTNTAFLQRAALHPAFVHVEDGRLSTSFIEERLDELVPDEPIHPNVVNAAAAAFVEASRSWHAGLDSFRLNAPRQTHVALWYRGSVHMGDTAARHAQARHRFSGPLLVSYMLGEAHGLALEARGNGEGTSSGDGAIAAPMPGKVTAVDVASGDHVSKGQRLLTLEAMKMEHALTAPFDGTVAELNVAAGDQVQVDAVLAHIAPSEPSGG